MKMFYFCAIFCYINLVSGNSFQELVANTNREGFPPEILFGTTDLSDPEQVSKLIDRLEDPEFQEAIRTAAMEHAAEELLNATDSGRSLLSEDWADPELCYYTWLNWLPWLECAGGELADRNSEQNALPPVYANQQECYKEL